MNFKSYRDASYRDVESSPGGWILPGSAGLRSFEGWRIEGQAFRELCPDGVNASVGTTRTQ